MSRKQGPFVVPKAGLGVLKMVGRTEESREPRLRVEQERLDRLGPVNHRYQVVFLYDITGADI
jgi:hypothetical protein